MTEHTSRFLSVPIEIRELIYDIIFEPTATIKISAAAQREYEYNTTTGTESTSFPADFESWAITPHPRSSQLLRVCRQFHIEASPFLYSLRTFDLTARESGKLLLHNIGPECFSKIRYISLDWDALQTFAWDLSKDDCRRGMAGLRCIQIASWRIRHMYGTSVRWRNVKSYERTTLQAASQIIEKHNHLKVLTEEPYRRKTTFSLGIDAARLSSNHRVKWRFITSEEELREGEVIVDIQRDLDQLTGTENEVQEEGFSLPVDDMY